MKNHTDRKGIIITVGETRNDATEKAVRARDLINVKMRWIKMNMSKHGISESSGEKKYPILITVCFFLITSLVSFFYHDFWTIFDLDGLFFLSAGQQILEGTGSNVAFPYSGPAGPILFATLEIITNNGLYATKLVSVISGTAIVFFSYHVFRNIIN